MHTQAAHHLNTYFSGTVTEKLSTAKKLVITIGDDLLRDKSITETISRLYLATSSLNSQMLAMGMDRLCSHCASKANGGCCSAYMANNIDAILLLMNALMDVRAEQLATNRECCFLGAKGCTLLIKPIFCLNYNCIHIHAAAEEHDMKKLEHLAGILLQEQINLETKLLAFISRQRQ